MITSNQEKHTSKNILLRFLISRFNKKLISFIDLSSNRLLDVGCGEGFTLEKIYHLNKKINLYGIDNYKHSIKEAKILLPKAKLEVGDIYNIAFKNNSFDTVICNEVLEHLKFPDEALKELMRVTKKRLIISVPNEPWFQITNLFRLRYLKNFGNHPEHINRWNFFSIKRMFKDLTYNKISYTFTYPWTFIVIDK